MSGTGLYCPVEECERNSGGYCAVRGDAPLGFAATAALFTPGQPGFMAPFGPAIGMLGNGLMADGRPPATDSWGMWRNCPRLRAEDLKK